MKASFLLKTLLTAVIISSSATAFADPPKQIVDTGHSGDLQVIGTVTPKACSITFTESGKVGPIDFGDIQADWTTAGQMYKIPQPKATLAKIACKGGAIPLVLSFIDNKPDTVPTIAYQQLPTGSEPFGLGAVDNKNIGAYTVETSYYGMAYTDAAGNRFAAMPTVSTDGQQWASSPSASVYMKTGSFYMAWHKGGVAGDEPVDATSAEAVLTVHGYLNDENNFPRGARITLAGLMTVKVSYLG